MTPQEKLAKILRTKPEVILDMERKMELITGKKNVIEKIDSSVIGLHLDTFHMNIEEKLIGQVIKEYSSYLAYLHFADSNRLSPGLGHINFSEIILALKEINYNGYIGVEALPLPDSYSAAKQALSYIGKLCN